MPRDATLERAISSNRLVSLVYGGQVFTTRVEASDDGGFSVSAPYDGASPIAFHAGDTVEVQADYDAGSIHFRTRVSGRRVEGIPVVTLGWPETYSRQQRREYVRVPVRMPVHLVIPAIGGHPECTYTATTRDLGGGGLQAQITGRNPGAALLGQRLHVMVDLGDGFEPVRAAGTVVRARQPEKSDVPACEIGVEFVQVSERDRNRICRHIFNRQIELRRRGLL